ncbi:MAG: hypothetical protein ACO271_12465, partial [Burkholderiales bacterium]
KDPAAGAQLVIYGENGTGKSHMARNVHRWLSAVSRTQMQRYQRTERGWRMVVHHAAVSPATSKPDITGEPATKTLH